MAFFLSLFITLESYINLSILSFISMKLKISGLFIFFVHLAASFTLIAENTTTEQIAATSKNLVAEVESMAGISSVLSMFYCGFGG
jgi:hypothetical protein